VPHPRWLCANALLALLPALTPGLAAGQGPRDAFPAATTLSALTAYPGFYHQRQVVVRGEARLDDRNHARLLPPGGVERGIWLRVPEGKTPEGTVEVRGQFWDVGRFDPADPQVAGVDLPGWVTARVGDRWPAQGEMPVLNVASVAAPTPPSSTPTVRQLSLDPLRYDGGKVTVAGQFGGRNLYGDLPQSPRVARFEFVLRAAGGAVWVTGIEPRGRGWRLNVDARVDTGQWLQVTGTVKTGNGLVWVEATQVDRTTAQEQEAPPPPPPALAPAPPPEVIFSVPSDQDTDVPPASPVRIQFSRDLDPETLQGRVRVSYVGQEDAPPIPVKTRFDPTNRVLYLTFEAPFERYRTVRVELREGILGTDGQKLEPFTLTFTTGG
jgi:hypothetical protein